MSLWQGRTTAIFGVRKFKAGMLAFVALLISAVGTSVSVGVLSTRKLEKEQELGSMQKVLGTRSDDSRNVQAKVLLGTLGRMVGRIVEARKVGDSSGGHGACLGRVRINLSAKCPPGGIVSGFDGTVGREGMFGVVGVRK